MASAESAAATPTIDELQQAERALTFDYGDAPAAAPAGGRGLGVFAMFRVILVLALVAAAIYGLVFLLKRGKAAGASANIDPFLKVLAITPLTAKSAAAVLGLGDKAWLVGIGDNSVSLIAEFSDKETIDAMRLAYSEKDAATRAKYINFKDILSKLTGAKNTSPNIENNLSQGALKKQRDRLKGL